MAIVTFGNTSRVETGIEYNYNYDDDVGNSLTITYEMPEEVAEGSVPALGSTTSRMAGVVLLEKSIKPGEAGISTVTLKYGKKKSEGSSEEEEPGGGSDPGGSNTPTEEDEVGTWSVDGSVNDVSILAHPKAQAQINDAQREYLLAYINGTRPWDMVAELKEDGSPKLDGKGNQVMKPFSELLKSLSNNGAFVLNLIRQGKHSYRSPGATFRETKIITNGMLSLSDLGKIATPSNAPSVSGNRNWLLVGCNFYKDTNMKRNRWKAEYLYELSDEGGWDKDIYS